MRAPSFQVQLPYPAEARRRRDNMELAVTLGVIMGAPVALLVWAELLLEILSR